MTYQNTNFIFVFNFFFADSGRVIYTSEKEGSDESGDGSVQKPFKTVMQVGRRGFFPYRKKQHSNIMHNNRTFPHNSPLSSTYGSLLWAYFGSFESPISKKTTRTCFPIENIQFCEVWIQK